jgi:quinol monooxygenase YgiN
MIITYGQVQVPEGRRAEVTERAAALQNATNAETGCIEYVFSWVVGEPASLALLERWVDEDAIYVHKAADYAVEFTAWIGTVATAAPSFVSFTLGDERQP